MTIQTWILGLAQAGLGASAAAVLLALAQRALRRRVAARWFCIVWLALAVRLVIAVPLPALVRLPLPGAAGQVFALSGYGESARPQADAGREGPQLLARPDAADTPTAAEPRENPPGPAGNEDEPPAPAPEDLGDGAAGQGGTPPAAVWLFAVWALGCGGVLIWRCAGHLYYRRQLLRWALPPDERQQQFFEREAAGMGIRRPVRLVQSAEGPLLLGPLRPVLALPPLKDGPDAPDAPESDLALILRHELAHLARQDLAFKALLTVACAMHWANPLVWWMARRASAEMELACDDAATQHATPAQRRSYGEAIIAAASRRRKGLAGPALGTGFWGGKSGLRRRFENLVNGPAVPRRRAWAVFCLLAAGVLAGSWLLGAAGARLSGDGPDDGSAGALAASSQPGAADTAEEPWQQTVVDFALNDGAFAAPVFAGDGETITAMQCEQRAEPENWQPEAPAVKLSLLLPEGWTVHPAADGEEVYASGNGIRAPFNLTDETGEWVGSMQYGSFTADQLKEDEFYGSGSHAAYYWLWANPGGPGWDETSYRAAAGDAFLSDPLAAGAALCETTGQAAAGHEGVLAHDGTLERFVVIELRAGALTEAERMRLAGSIRLMAGNEPADTPPALPEEPALPEGYVWQEANLVVTGAPTDSRIMSERAAVRLALPEGCTLRLEEPTSARTDGPAAAVILRDGDAIGRIECSEFAAPAPLDWPVENPREIYAFLMMSAHAGWDYDYQEIARSETVSIATCLVGRQAYPRGPGPQAPEPGHEPENYRDGWWYQKGILCADNTLGVYAAVELDYSEFSDTVRLAIAGSIRLAAG